MLLIFAFALGHTKYAPAIVRDMIQYYHRVPQAIREELNTIMGLYDEGINGKVEESNARQKGYTVSETRNGVQAGALLVNCADALREAQLNFSDKDPSKNHMKETRTPTDLALDIDKCVVYLLQNRVFAKSKASEATVTMVFDNSKEIIKDLSILSLKTFGEERRTEWVTKYIGSKDSKFPKCQRGRSFIERVVTNSGGKTTRIVAGEDGGEDDGSEIVGVPDPDVQYNHRLDDNAIPQQP